MSSNTPCDTKKCTKCNQDKPLTEFGNKVAGRKRADCKVCHRVFKNKWKERNPERHAATRAAYLEKNKEATAIKRKIREAAQRLESRERTRLKREAAKQERLEKSTAAAILKQEQIQKEMQERRDRTEMQCGICCAVKPVSEFYSQVTGTKYTKCKKCHNVIVMQRRNANEAIKEHYRLRRKKWMTENPPNKAERAEYMKRWNEDRKAKGTKKSRKRGNKIVHNLRNRMRKIIKTKGARGSALIGCTGQFLQRHIEAQFTKGMTWANYGQWHVDHIIPCAAFDHSDPDQVRQCWNWQNLRPLWAADNLAKSDTITHPQQHLALSFL